MMGEAAAARARAQELVPLLKSFCRGPYGLALGGAHAKGVDDAHSDLDLYVFCDDVRCNAERTRLAEAAAEAIDAVVSWGVDAGEINAGTDFEMAGTKVESWLRGASTIGQAVAECVQGIVRQDLVTWTVAGFYNHCCLSDLQVMVPLDDPDGLIADWKEQVSTYPPGLRRAIVLRHLSAARFWPHNFHYTTAVERGDAIYVSGIVQQVLHNLIQVLFAVNQTYFPGDKKLATALGSLSQAPDGLVEIISALVATPAPADIEAFRAQQRALQDLLSATESLVRTQMPDD